MTGKEFIEMQKQDIETKKPADKRILSEVIAAMEEILLHHPDAEIDPKKTAEECYKQMYDYGKKHKTDGYYVFTPMGTMKFICEYLGVGEIPVGLGVAAQATDTAAEQKAEPVKEEKKRRTLEEFF